MGNTIPPSSGGYPNPVPPVNALRPARKVGPEDKPDDPEQQEGDGNEQVGEGVEETRECIANVTYDKTGKIVQQPPPPTIDERA